MELDTTPAVDAVVRQALLGALREAGVDSSRASGYEGAWRRAALREAVEGDELELGYALSPRSTLGATRA
jgi:hypothetical protein